MIVTVLLVAGSFAATVALTPAGGPSTPITYSASFDVDGIEVTDSGWSTMSFHGYEVTVTGGEVTTRTVQLGACDHDHGDGLIGRLLSLVSPPVASAGHSSGDLNPALLETSLVESLIDLDRTTFGTVVGESDAYCAGHWATARPTDLSSTVSFWIEGTWVLDGEAPVAFRFENESAWGAQSPLVDRDGNAVHVDRDSPILAELVRTLTTVFDEVDFATDTTNGAQQVLAALTGGATWIVLEAETHRA